ncbi:DUF6371 domain-containing protein [Rudanella paleaurantiibacter]|uniref:DUF6371 domain-containing protein n=1 Tax=Rudanella paleaurantiibacter TaxID=2614655 RepID=UPI001628AAFC|nr:DUF6371 domain-containing protein [Rudanella paleaurantiibacter]
MTTCQPRYQLPKKAIKIDCPQCSPRHRKTLSQYVDRTTGDVLPLPFGRCDRESNCGYFLSPYHKGSSGLSFVDEQKGPPIPKEWFKMAAKWKKAGTTPEGVVTTLIQMEGATLEQAERVKNYIFLRPAYPTQPTQPAPVHVLPDEVLHQSLGRYEHNEFARFLVCHFGTEIATTLLQRFKVGTSTYFKGACVFWLVDEQNRVRGGQIALYDQTGHKVKYTNKEGERRACITSVRHALARKYKGETPPEWLAKIPEDAETWPVVFGLPQLHRAPIDAPIAIVEGPKTAIICSYYLPEFIWLAVGGKSYLKPERLEALRGRKIRLFPDLNAYHDTKNAQGRTVKGWLSIADQLQAAGFDVSVSDILEQLATDEEREKGLDMADYLLSESNTITALSDWSPGQLVTFDQSRIERLTVDFTSDYPPEWDAPAPADAAPIIRPIAYGSPEFHQWHHNTHTQP